LASEGGSHLKLSTGTFHLLNRLADESA